MRVEEIHDISELNYRFFGSIRHLYKRNLLSLIEPLGGHKKPSQKLTVAFKDDYIIAFMLSENRNIRHLAVDSNLSKREKKKAVEKLYEKIKK